MDAVFYHNMRTVLELRKVRFVPAVGDLVHLPDPDEPTMKVVRRRWLYRKYRDSIVLELEPVSACS